MCTRKHKKAQLEKYIYAFRDVQTSTSTFLIRQATMSHSVHSADSAAWIGRWERTITDTIFRESVGVSSWLVCT